MKTLTNNYLRDEGCVFGSVCVCVILSVNSIAQKALNSFVEDFIRMWIGPVLTIY